MKKIIHTPPAVDLGERGGSGKVKKNRACLRGVYMLLGGPCLPHVYLTLTSFLFPLGIRTVFLILVASTTESGPAHLFDRFSLPRRTFVPHGILEAFVFRPLWIQTVCMGSVANRKGLGLAGVHHGGLCLPACHSAPHPRHHPFR